MAFGIGEAISLGSLALGAIGKKKEGKQAEANNRLQRDEFEFRRELATAPAEDALGNRFTYSPDAGFKQTLAPNQQTLAKAQEAEQLAVGPGGMNSRLKFNTDANRRGQLAGQLSEQMLHRAGRVPALAANDIYNINKAETDQRVNAAFDTIAKMVALNSVRTGGQLPDDTEQRALALAEAQPSYMDAVEQAILLEQARDPYLLNVASGAEALAQGGYVPFSYAPPNIESLGQGQRYLGAQITPPRDQAVQSTESMLANALNAGRELFYGAGSGGSATPSRQLGNSATGPRNGPPRFVGAGYSGV